MPIRYLPHTRFARANRKFGASYPAIIDDGNSTLAISWDELSTITKDENNKVSKWEDFLGGANYLENVLGGSHYPEWTTDGVLFDGVDDFFAKAFTLVQPCMVYAIIKQKSFTNEARLWDGATSNGGALYQSSPYPRLSLYAGAFINNAEMVDDTYSVVRITYNGANSVFQVDDNVAVEGNVGSNDMNGFSLGARGSGNNPSHIQVKTIIIRKIVDTTANNSIINEYLKKKITKSAIDNSLYSMFTELNHILIMGQSLASGTAAGVVTDTQAYDNLFKFKGGVRTWDCHNLNEDRRLELDRVGDPAFGEMIDFANKFSAEDTEENTYKYSELIPLIEQRLRYNPIYDGETIVGYEYPRDGELDDGNAFSIDGDGETSISGFAETINLLMLEGGVSLNKDFICSDAAFGSLNFWGLMPLDREGDIQSLAGGGSNLNYYEVALSDITSAKAIADSLGKDYKVSCLIWIHENSPSSVIWILKRFLLQLFTMLNDDIKEITGQSDDIIFITHQSELSQNYMKAEYEIGIEDTATEYTEDQLTAIASMINPTVSEYDKTKVILGNPIYPYQKNAYDGGSTDNVHLDEIGQKMLGMAMSHAYKKHLLRETKYLPLYPISYTITAVDATFRIRVLFNVPVKPLIIDDAAIYGTQANQNAIDRGDVSGFILYDTVGEDYVDDIVSAAVYDEVYVDIITNSDPTDLELHYAHDYVALETFNKTYGNLRDSQGDDYTITHDETEYRIDNWCTAFELTLE